MRADAVDSAASDDQAREQSFLYDAFISYDHDDRAIALGIQRGLHRIGRRMGQLHALRVFRDSTDLTASPDLWGKVTEAMNQSRYMIVVLSPHAVASKWVNKEVAHWLQQRGPDHMLFVVSDGRVTWEEAGGRFDPDRSDAALPVLTQPGVLATEPLYVDVTEDAPWDPAAALFREKITDLAAPMHGKPKYELASEDLREQHRFRRLRRAAIAGLVVLTVCALAAAGIAIVQRQEADRQRHEAIRQRNEAEARRLVAEGQAILAGGQPGTELQAIDKLLAAQLIAENPDTGALLTTLSRQPRLQWMVDLPQGGRLGADGQRIATHTESGVALLNTETGQPIGDRFAHPEDSIGPVSPDARYVAMISGDNTIQVWDSATRQPFGHQVQDNDKPWALAVSSDGRRVAAIHTNNIVRLWDTQTGRQIGKLTGHSGGVYALAFSTDGRRLVTIGYDDVRIWDTDSGAALDELMRGGGPGGGRGPASVAFSPDGHTLAVGGTTLGRTGSLGLWNADTGAAIGPPVSGAYGQILSVAFSPSGDRIATGGMDKTLRLWDAHTGTPIGDPLRFQEPVREVAFTRDGGRIVGVTGGLDSDQTMQIVNADPDARLPAETRASRAAQLAQMTTDAGFAYRLKVTTNGPQILVLDDRALRRLNADSGDQLGQAIVSDALRGISAYDVSPNDRWVGVVGPGNDIQVIDATNGRPRGGPLKMPGANLKAFDFSPDGQTLATASDDNMVRLWDWQSGRQIGEPMTGHQYNLEWVQFSNDGRRLYSRSWDSIRVWDSATRQPIGKPIDSDGRPFTAMRISPDGRDIAGANLARIQRWDAQSGEPVGRPMEGHNGKVADIAYSPDGHYLVSVDNENTLRFWDVASGRQLGEPIDTTALGNISNVEFDRDGSRVFVTAARVSSRGGPPSGGGIWQLPAPAGWADALCDKLKSNPTQKQWEHWISPDIGYIKLCSGKGDSR